MSLFDEPLLTAAEERVLGQRIEAGVLARALLDGVLSPDHARGASRAELSLLERQGNVAYDRFTRANLRLVAKLARQEATRLGLNREELFQEGTIGLLEAVQRWDFRRGLRFTTYAVTRIRNRIAAAAAQRCGELHVSRRSAATVQLVQGAARQMEREGAPVRIEVLAERIGMGERTAAAWLSYAAPAALSDAVIATYAAPAAEDPAEQVCEEPAVDVALLLAALPEPARGVIAARYGIGTPRRTREQVAHRLGCSARTVARIEEDALEELRGRCPAAARAA